MNVILICYNLSWKKNYKLNLQKTTGSNNSNMPTTSSRHL